MGKRYGSKAAYQKARAKMARDQDDYERQRQAERAKEAAPMLWSIALAAAINSGKDVGNATTIADAALAAYDHRFVRKVPREGSDA